MALPGAKSKGLTKGTYTFHLDNETAIWMNKVTQDNNISRGDMLKALQVMSENELYKSIVSEVVRQAVIFKQK
jgi:hypothetical protein